MKPSSWRRHRVRSLTPLLMVGLLIASCGGESEEDEAPETGADAGSNFDPENCRLDGNVTIVGGEQQGLEKYCEVAGNVEVIWQPGQPPITDDDIEQLRNVHTIQGVLYVSGTALESLEGLRSLQVVASDVVIDSNGSLSNVYGLQKLKKIGGLLAILQHSVLTDLTALESLEEVGTGIKIEDNLALQNMDSLQFIGAVSHSVTIRNNPKLKSLKGLTSLHDAGSKGLTIEGNHLISHDEGLDSLEASGQELIIRNNDNLLVLTRLKSLEHVVKIEISGNEALEGIDGFGKLSQVDHVSISDNKALKQIQGFSSVPYLATIEIKKNKWLQQLTAFANLKVATSIWLEDNQNLSEVRFNTLGTVDTLALINNDAFGNFKGFLPLKIIHTLKICGKSALSKPAIDDFIKSRHDPKPTLVGCD